MMQFYHVTVRWFPPMEGTAEGELVADSAAAKTFDKQQERLEKYNLATQLII